MSHPNPEHDLFNVLDDDVKCNHEDVDEDNRCCLVCGEDLTEKVMSDAYDRAKDYRKYGE